MSSTVISAGSRFWSRNSIASRSRSWVRRLLACLGLRTDVFFFLFAIETFQHRARADVYGHSPFPLLTFCGKATRPRRLAMHAALIDLTIVAAGYLLTFVGAHLVGLPYGGALAVLI